MQGPASYWYGVSVNGTIPLMSEETVRPQNTPPSVQGEEQAPPSPFPAPSAPPPARPDDDGFAWTASEYIAHHKDSKWYASVIGITVAVVALTYFITRDRISAITIFVAGILFCVAAARKPRILTYVIDRDGITIGPRFHPYVEFKSFTVVRDGAFANIQLVPLKWFMPLTSLYCAPEDEETVLKLLSTHVPYEERPHAYVDRLARRIRF